MYKPAGHNSLSPYLIVENAQVTLDFIDAVFGAKPEMVHRMPDGSIGHAEVRIDDTILMVGQMPDGATGAHVHVYVPDVDDSFARARNAGGKVVQEPVQKDDPDKRGGVTDPSGITWWLATTQGVNKQ
ncbi:VOC family protein [Devosia ginsengisoli]|uniref:VOC family protein n=1 Tax=Devosia ginsengisoli TaxID=400770 RepID=A0A5B8LSZ3_9HYPH|nr:VOC family protein [Devosia ginsengisoli]QDZ11313.1 VOC family protein [Devosia ginsengisoli]